MTPRPALTALLFAAACVARAAAEPCDYTYPPKIAPSPDELARGAVAQLQEGISDRDCRFLHGLEEPVARLAAAAGLAGGVGLSHDIPIEEYFNAYAMADGSIVVNDRFIARLRDKKPAAVWVMAHEVGHMVQLHKGVTAEYDRALADRRMSAKERFAASRIFESQADRIGADLLALAGYPIENPARISEAFVDSGFRLNSEHSHPAHGIRWLEALKQQDALLAARQEESLSVLKRRTRKLLSTPAFDRIAGAPTDADKSSPLEWAAAAPAAGAYRSRKPYEPSTKLAQFDSQGRLPTARGWQVALAEPPLSDRLALRARSKGEPTTYASAVWTGAWDWLTSGDWRKKEPAKGSTP